MPIFFILLILSVTSSTAGAKPPNNLCVDLVNGTYLERSVSEEFRQFSYRAGDEVATSRGTVQIVERLGIGMEAELYRIKHRGIERTWKVLHTGEVEIAEGWYRKAKNSGLPTVELVETISTPPSLVLNYHAGVSVEIYLNSSKYSESEKSSLLKRFEEWKSRYCKDQTISLCKPYNVLYEAHTKDFILIDPF